MCLAVGVAELGLLAMPIYKSNLGGVRQVMHLDNESGGLGELPGVAS